MADIIKAGNISLTAPKVGTTAIEVRRGLVEVPEVRATLSAIEMNILEASTHTQIKDMADVEAVPKFRKLLRFISYDIGYSIPKEGEVWAYQQTRIYEVLKRYYGTMSLREVKMAFELLVTGELDAFLPKDGQGNPDRKHYQQFNVEYVSKVLNAYKARRERTVSKAYQALPAPTRRLSSDKEQRYASEIDAICRREYLRYKYTARIDFGVFNDIYIYAWLVKIGRAQPIYITEADRQRAVAAYLKRATLGVENKYDEAHVRKHGTQAKQIDGTAYIEARRRLIFKVFDEMLEDEYI